MSTLRLLLLPFLFITSIAFGQHHMNDRFNKVTGEELNMTTYAKDPTAHAVVLEEYGENYFEAINDRIQLVKHYYVKIKILDKEGLNEANVSIPYYRSQNNTEIIKNIRAITHNSGANDELQKDQIFTVDANAYWSEKRFTFPNAKAGSVIEYQYTLVSPFIYNFEGWDFQSNIPKMYSEFNAKIPANYRYNRVLKGTLELSENEAYVEKRCFRIPGFKDRADCEVLKYAMKDVPAFKDEAHMLSRNNYLSRIAFELSEVIRISGGKDVYTKTWKDVDKDMRKDKDIGAQMKKNNFFKNQLPEEILNESDDLKRAQKVFTFIQDHYTWNENYGLFGDINVRNAFQEKFGNVGEINISLVNSLLAADLQSEIVLLSTRAKGLPTQKYPVISEFNYVIAKVTIGNETFLLDATDKKLSFGILPLRALNYNGRVMDFKNPSYWFTIAPMQNNRKNTVISINVEEDGSAQGKLSQTNTGYLAYNKRLELEEADQDSYLDDFEKTFSFIEVADYEVLNKNEVEKPIREIYDLELDDFSSNQTFIDPFFIKLFPDNPFQLENRQYPVDFAYSRIYTTRFMMTIPETHEYTNVPEDITFAMEDNKIVCSLKTVNQNGQLNMLYKLVINNYHFTADEYQELKDFFSKLATLEKNTRLIIKRKQ